MFNQLTINSNTYPGFTLEEALKGARTVGFTKIEMTPAGTSSLEKVDQTVQQSFDFLKQLLDGGE